MIKSSNPALNSSVFSSEARFTPTHSHPDAASNTMSIQGTVNKTGIALLIMVCAAGWTWGQDPVLMNGLSVLGAIAGLVVALVLMLKKTWAPVLVPAYAGLEGLFIGAFSATFEQQYPGIVMQAVGLTFATLFALLSAYKSGLIKPTENFKLGVFAATAGIGVFYLIAFLFGLFGVDFPIIYGNSPMSIGLSVVIVVVAALNLVMDFDFIENGEKEGAPKYMEWYAAFGLLVTLIWLYIEIVRLLSKLASRR